ncbi:MAG: hypothetical protein P8P74_02760 [Crocinitomicaceae bacterium]|nr:hypothetical protein [Crocinitomicaceae bacterium]
MDKTVILLPLLFVLQMVKAQEVKFSDGLYENGLIYPVVEFSGNVDAKNALNANILEIVSDYKEQDYCIGQYGFVQRTSFIQLNFYFNCIDLDESASESHLFNLSDGEVCSPSVMFREKHEKRYRAFFHKKVTAHYAQHEQEMPSNAFMNELSIDDCDVILLEEGLEISLDDQNWPSEKLLIKWEELRPFLKTIFI